MRAGAYAYSVAVPATMEGFWLPNTVYHEPPAVVGGLTVAPDGVLHVQPAEHIAQAPEYYVGVRIELPGDGTVVLANTYAHELYVAMWDEVRRVVVGRGQIKPLGRLPLDQRALPRRWCLLAWCVSGLPHPLLGGLMLGGPVVA